VIHPTAIIDKKAEIEETCEVGPYCIIEGDVKIGKGTRLQGHVFLQGRVEIGDNCTISPFASIGGPPQDTTYKGEDTMLVVGNGNIIKEYVTLNRGTPVGGGVTRIGNDNFLMAYAHVAHDCSVGNSVIMANCATLAGHVHVDDYTILAGLCAVHQFCRIGKYAFISGVTGVAKDIPPFMIAAGSRAKLYGLNVVGLERRGFSKEDINQLKKAYRMLFRSTLPLTTSLKIVQEELSSPHVEELLRFIQSSKRGICR
jgi:UDP-N-acetylglucosamine acyltransferase